MSVFSDLFGPDVLDGLNEDINPDINDAKNDNDNNNESIVNNVNMNDNDNVDDENKEKQPLYKIVQHVTMYGFREQDHYTLNAAVAHWESLTYLLASIWYQYDNKRGRWNIKDSYGTIKATQKIIHYINNKYNQKDDSDAVDAVDHKLEDAPSNSILSYLTSLAQYEDNNNNDNDDNGDDEKIEVEKTALLDDFFKWTEVYTQKSGVKPLSNLDIDHANCNDLIVSNVWSVGFQCYYLSSYDMAQQTWKSLGLWYASVWFTRNTKGTFVVHDNFGTSDSVRRICRFVNDAQETWNYIKIKKKTQKIRALNENDDNIIIGKKQTMTKNDILDDNNNNDNDDDNKLCIVCLDGDRDHIIIPCGHICICKKCKDNYKTDDATCPMCRGKVENVIKTFN